MYALVAQEITIGTARVSVNPDRTSPQTTCSSAPLLDAVEHVLHGSLHRVVDVGAHDRPTLPQCVPGVRHHARVTDKAQDGVVVHRVAEGHDLVGRDAVVAHELPDARRLVHAGRRDVVAHEEIDLRNPDANRGNPGFSDEERGSFEKLLDAGFVDTFRQLHPTQTEAYSWWSYRMRARATNTGWRIDYFLVSQDAADRVADASILSDVYGSDHCPVGLTIRL